MKKCIEYEVEDARPRGRLEVVQKDCQAHKLNWDYAMDRSRWRKQIKDNC